MTGDRDAVYTPLMPTVVKSIRMPIELAQALDDLAKEEETTVNALMLEGVRNIFDPESLEPEARGS